MKPLTLPICYCKAHDYSHVHLKDGEPDMPNRGDIEDELQRLRRYERAVVAWKTELAPLRRNRVIVRMERLAAASVKRSKGVRRA